MIYTLKDLYTDGFNCYYDSDVGVIIAKHTTAIFLPGFYSKNFSSDDLMFQMAAHMFNHWRMMEDAKAIKKIKL